MTTITRRSFVRRSTALGGGIAGMGALQAYGAQLAAGQTPGSSDGYGPLMPKTAQNDPSMVLNLPEGFNFVVVSRQGVPMSDGNPTPGIFDGTGSYRGRNDDETILIRNHENRRSRGEIPVIVPEDKRYDSDPSYIAGDVKLVVRRRRAGRNPDGTPRFTYEVVRDFAILGGTDTNCAGGVIGDSWYTCEETVNRGASGLKHGYNFAIPADANSPVKAVALPQQGRFVHEAVAELDGILYETEDNRIVPDPTAPGQPRRKPLLGSCLYRFVPTGRDDRGRGRRGSLEGAGKLQALKLRDEFHANMDTGRRIGDSFRVEWVDVDEPDHDDDTNNRRDRVEGFTPTRVQAQDKGAAFFDREEGIWTDSGNIDGGRNGNGNGNGDGRNSGKLYFDCTEGGDGSAGGQVWEYDPRRKRLTLIFQSTDPTVLNNPDNLVIVPRTGDIFLQEDGPADQFVRGLTPEGEIFNFAQTVTNDTEFCGGCFDADGGTFFVSQQGDRLGENEPPQGAPESRAVMYAIYGPFEDRAGRRGGDDDDDRGRGRGDRDDD